MIIAVELRTTNFFLMVSVCNAIYMFVILVLRLR